MYGFINYSLFDFCEDIESIVSKELDYQFLGSSQGAVDPEQILREPNVLEIRFILKKFGLVDLELLAIASWFFKTEYQALLRLDIEERLKKCGDDLTRERIFPLLNSRNSALEYFYNLAPYSKETWFGNIKPRLQKLLKEIKLKVLKINPNLRIRRYTGYCRGYGSSRQAKKVEKQVLLNNIIYYQRKAQKDAVDKIEHLNTQLFFAGLNDNDFEIQRLLYEKARQEFLRDMTI